MASCAVDLDVILRRVSAWAQQLAVEGDQYSSLVTQVRINVDKPIKRRPSENQLVSRKTREISCHLLSRKICMKLFCLFGLMTTVLNWEKYWL